MLLSAFNGIQVSADVADDPPVILVMAEMNPLTTISGMTDTYFAEKVEELSGGSIKVDLRASGVLGTEDVILDGMIGGDDSIDIFRISALALTDYSCKKASLLAVPFIWENRDHFWKFVDSDLSRQFLSEPSELGMGVVGIFYAEEGFRHFFTTSPISGLEDLSGMKLRVSTDPIMSGAVKGFGAYPTVVSFGELYSALQTGVVDGAEQPIANYRSNSFQEVAPNLILDGHTLGVIQVIISERSLNHMTPDQQDVIFEAGRLAQQYNRELSEGKENEVLDALREEGVNIIEVDDPGPWREACSDVIQQAAAGQEELYQQLLDLAE